MPSLITPPEIDKRRSDIFEGDNGSGRRPPTDKRTGGNGDNENWSNRPQGRRGPRERLVRARTGLFFALFGDLMFFIALVSVFFVTKAAGHYDAYSRYVNEWLPTAIPTVLWLNTAVLLLSSVSAEIARQSMFHEHHVMDEWFGYGRPISRRATIWLGVTLLLGGLFLAGQWLAWSQLASQHVFYRSNPSSHFFYIITVSHAVHLFLGVTALIVALAALKQSKQIATRQVFVDGTVWYWHTMGLLWVLLFILLEFFQ